MPLLTEDLFVVATTDEESAFMPMPTCSVCGCYVNLRFREVHKERCKV